MKLLCFDIASGGVTAALFDSTLETLEIAETSWNLAMDEDGAAALSVDDVVDGVKQVIRALSAPARSQVDAIGIGAFMHNLVLLDQAGQPLSPVFTWLDRRGENGLRYVYHRIGDRFHTLTGCRYHPMFPVFKLAAMHLNEPDLLARTGRFVSIKSLLINRLTGEWVEDQGTASASGLLNIASGDWDAELLHTLDLSRAALPDVTGTTAIAGHVTSKSASEFGLVAGVPVIAGSGDGFLANIGSGCETPGKIAVSLGTSAVARQRIDHPVLDRDAGTFCYREGGGAYLLGCAGSNGGNVLDWGRRIFAAQGEAELATEPPVFIPLLHGERSPEWDPDLKGSWHGLTSRHTAADLARSILEGVIFNLGYFVDIVQQTSGVKATNLVLSGNGFLQPAAAAILARTTGIPTWMPKSPGLASLRGAAISVLRALQQPDPGLSADRVAPLPDPQIGRRYADYLRLRTQVKKAGEDDVPA
jgi:gluconokinase